MNKNNLIIFAIIIIVAGIGYVTYTLTAPKWKTTTGVENGTSEITIGSELPGSTITVADANFKEKSFLAVRREENGEPGGIIGVSNLLPVGKNKNIVINLNQATREAEIIYIVAHIDGDRNGIFQFPGPDIPLNDSNGNSIIARVTVSGNAIVEQPAPGTASANNLVAYNNDGFNPKVIIIKAGQSVTFENISDLIMWVASNPHPAHTDLSGFDERSPVPNGGKYTYTFTTVGTWGYHNHTNPSHGGKVVVE